MSTNSEALETMEVDGFSVGRERLQVAQWISSFRACVKIG